MKYLILNKNKEVVLTKEKAAFGTLPDEVLQISSAELTNVVNYGYVQIVDENLKPENIPVGKTILGIDGNAKDNSPDNIINGTVINLEYNCTSIRTHACEKCTSLTTVSLPQCSYVGSYAFGSCSSLTTVNLPQCSYISAGAFNFCSSLTTVSLPQCSYIDYGVFYNCSSLTSISLPKCTYISASAFYGCTKLQSLYLNVSKVPTLYSSNAFASTLLSVRGVNGYGSIYIPSSLYYSFRRATNWAAYADRFVSYF